MNNRLSDVVDLLKSKEYLVTCNKQETKVLIYNFCFFLIVTNFPLQLFDDGYVMFIPETLNLYTVYAVKM